MTSPVVLQASDFSGRKAGPYRIGLMGMGDIAREHAQAIARVDGFSVTAVCDVDVSRAEQWAASLGCRSFTKADAFFAYDIDVVVLLLPHHLHAPMALKAMNAGLHVIVEKPMATSVSDCHRMMQAARQARRLLMVADTAEYSPGALETAGRYHHGELGAFMTGSMLTTRQYFYSNRPAWFLDASRSGGGMFANVGIHRLAMARAAMPGLCPTEVAAASMPLASHPVEACTTALVRYEHGAALHHQENGYVPSPPWLQNAVHLLFERGMVGWDAKHWHFSPTQGDTVSQSLPVAHGYVPVYSKAFELLRTGSLEGGAQGSTQDVAIVSAAYESAQTGGSVLIEDIDVAVENVYAR